MKTFLVITFLFTSDNGSSELLASHLVDMESGFSYPVSQDHPAKLGAIFNMALGEWVIYENI